jgi:hypothetical protein
MRRTRSVRTRCLFEALCLGCPILMCPPARSVGVARVTLRRPIVSGFGGNMKVKHWAGTVEVTDEYLVITFEGVRASDMQKKVSPLALRLDGVLRIEQQKKTGEQRWLRFVMSETQKVVELDQDPYVVKFLPVLRGARQEVVGFVTQVTGAVVQARSGVGTISGSTPIDPLVTVNDLKDPKTMSTTADVPETDAAETRPTATTGSAHWCYKSPPNWPAPPSAGWTPPDGWQPDPTWELAPDGWQFWVPAGEPGAPSQSGSSIGPVDHQRLPVVPVPTPVAESNSISISVAPPTGQDAQAVSRVDTTIGMFGVRGKAKELAAEVSRLETEMSRLRNDNALVHAQMEQLGMLSVLELEQRKTDLITDLERIRREHQIALDALRAEQANTAAQLTQLRQQVVTTQDTLILQEVGVYDYTHPLDDSVAYKAELEKIKDQVRTMVRKDGGAVAASTKMTMNGSQAQGTKMVNEFSKLLLRAYNNEADNLVRGMRPYKLDTSKDRLTKARATIEKLGQSMDIAISAKYHQLRLKEMELTADYLEKVATEKEREKEDKARLREERLAQAEFDREREKLRREKSHYENAMAALEANGDLEGVERLKAELAEIDKAIEDVDYRAANIRAGYVYVISNLGSFGERMVKVGLTRRQDPLDRVKELSDASVPFNFDVHALHFSKDAVGVEAEMHRRLADRRVNRVNARREFFYATPAEVRKLLAEVAGDLLEFTELPEATEYHQSVNAAQSIPAAAVSSIDR